MKRLLLFCLLVNSLQSGAQELTSGEIQYNQLTMAGNAVFRTFDYRGSELRGSEMLLDRFMPARVTLRSGQSSNVDQLNLDVWKDEIVVKKDTIEKVIKSHLIKEVAIQGVWTDTIRLIPILKKTEKTIGFYQLIGKQDTIQCLKKYYKLLREPDYKGAYSPNRTYAELLDEQKYFVRLSNGDLAEFKSVKSLAALLPSNKEAILAYAKKNKIGTRSDDELAQLFNFINTLNNN